MVPPLGQPVSAEVKPTVFHPPPSVAGPAHGGVVVIIDDDEEDEISVVTPSPAREAGPSGAAPARDGGGDGSGGSGGVAAAAAAIDDNDMGDGMAMVASTVHLYPHARADCPSKPFIKAVTAESVVANKQRCEKCFCYACDVEASACTGWLVHCMAYDNPDWRGVRSRNKKGMALQIVPSMHIPARLAKPPGGGGSSNKFAGAPWRSTPTGGGMLHDSDEDEEEGDGMGMDHQEDGFGVGNYHYMSPFYHALSPPSHKNNKELDVEIAEAMPSTTRTYNFSFNPKSVLAQVNPQRGLIGHLDLYLPKCSHFEVVLGRNIVSATSTLAKSGAGGMSNPSSTEKAVLSELFSGTMWSSDKGSRRHVMESLGTCVMKSLLAVEWEGPTHSAAAPSNPARLVDSYLVRQSMPGQLQRRLSSCLTSRHHVCERHYAKTSRLTKDNCCRLRAKVYLLPAALGDVVDSATDAEAPAAEEDAVDTGPAALPVPMALALADVLNALTLYDPTPAPLASVEDDGAAASAAAAGSGGAGSTPPAAATPSPAAAARAAEKEAASEARYSARLASALQRGRLAQFEAREAARTKRKEQRVASVAMMAKMKAAEAASAAARARELRKVEAAEAADMDGLPAGMRVYCRSEAGGDRAVWSTVQRTDQPALNEISLKRLSKEFVVGYGERSLSRVSNLVRSPQFCVNDGRAAAAQPPDVNVQLRNYQLQALSWMEECEARPSISSPFWVKLHMLKAGAATAAGGAAGSVAAAVVGNTAGGGSAIVPFYYSPWTGHVSAEPPRATVGGILAEEMGTWLPHTLALDSSRRSRVEHASTALFSSDVPVVGGESACFFLRRLTSCFVSPVLDSPGSHFVGCCLSCPLALPLLRVGQDR